MSKINGGCNCGKCHWCIWETEPVEAIKILLEREIEKANRLERARLSEYSFSRADHEKGRQQEAKDMLLWIDRMQEAEKETT